MERGWWPDGRALAYCECGQPMEWATGMYLDSERNVAVLGLHVMACTDPQCGVVLPEGGAGAEAVRRALYAVELRDNPEKRPEDWLPVDTVVRVTPAAPPSIYAATRTIWDRTA